MSTPVVVQGTPVAYPTDVKGAATAGTGNNNHHTSAGFNSAFETNHTIPTTTAVAASSLESDSKQETSCNDPIFAILFYIALISICAVAAIYAPDALDSSETNGDTINEEAVDYKGYVTLTVVIVCLSFVGAGAGMALLMCIPQFLIKTALLFTVVMAGLWAVMSFLGGSIGMGILGLIFFAITCCYARAVWSRIPFATANLVTACTAIRSNLGVAIYAYFFAILAGAWSVAWSLAFVGLFDKNYECTEIVVDGELVQSCSNPSYGILFVLFLAFFFVQQVIQNSIHVVVAGTVGTWWYSPDECGCCSSAINNSFIRTITTSFGSICFGSFLVAIIQSLKAIANQARQNGDAQIFACIAECILGCLASIVEYFNKWAFIYVGLYGMPYMKAGKSVFDLFKNRGWDAVIADDLVGNVLFLISLIVGGVMGGIGLLIDELGDLLDDSAGDTKLIAFLLGFIVGLVITSILMSTIASGVNAVIVLFAEGPAEFQRNHPELSNKMREVWSQVYPGSI